MQLQSRSPGSVLLLSPPEDPTFLAEAESIEAAAQLAGVSPSKARRAQPDIHNQDQFGPLRHIVSRRHLAECARGNASLGHELKVAVESLQQQLNVLAVARKEDEERLSTLEDENAGLQDRVRLLEDDKAGLQDRVRLLEEYKEKAEPQVEQLELAARRSLLDVVRLQMLWEVRELRSLCQRTQWREIDERLRMPAGRAWLQRVGLSVDVLPLLGFQAGSPQQLANAAAHEFSDASVAAAVAAKDDERWDALLRYALRSVDGLPGGPPPTVGADGGACQAGTAGAGAAEGAAAAAGAGAAGGAVMAGGAGPAGACLVQRAAFLGARMKEWEALRRNRQALIMQQFAWTQQHQRQQQHQQHQQQHQHQQHQQQHLQQHQQHQQHQQQHQQHQHQHQHQHQRQQHQHQHQQHQHQHQQQQQQQQQQQPAQGPLAFNVHAPVFVPGQLYPNLPGHNMNP